MLLWMSERTAIRIGGQPSSGPLTTAVACAPRDRGDSPAARAPATGDDDEAMVLEPGRRAPTDVDPCRRRSTRWPAAAAATSSTRSPRFQATRMPSGASNGKPSSTRSARLATARAVTAGQRPRWAGSAARVSARVAATATRSASTDGVDDRLEEAGLLADRLDEQGALGREGERRAGRPGYPPPEPRSSEPLDAALAQQRDRRQAVEDVGTGDLGRVADAGQVDRPGPGEQQPDVTVDGRARRRRQVEAELREARIEGEAVLGRKLGKAFDARRERLTRGVQGTPPDRSRAVSSRGATPGVGIVSHRGREDRSSAVRPVHGRVSPDPSRTALPCLPQCGCRTLRSAARPASTRLSTNWPPGPRFVDKLPRRTAAISPSGRRPGPAGRACAGRHR